MSDKNDGQGGGYTVPLLAVVSLVATIFTPREEKFAFTRASMNAAREVAGGESRLWHDPLPPGVKADPSREANWSEMSSPQAKAAKALLLAVPSGKSAEDVESRCRTRFALHAAMGACGYEPEDASTLHYLTLWASGKSTADGSQKPSNVQPADGGSGNRSEQSSVDPVHQQKGLEAQRITFEKFRRSGSTGGKPVLAFWLPERELQKNPKLASDWAIVTRDALEPLASEVCLIGPSSTDSLDGTRLDGLVTNSPWVTGIYPSGFSFTSLLLRSFICADTTLAMTLKTELELRGVGADSQILMILERDSAFARSWQEHLENAWLPEIESANGITEEARKESASENNKRFFTAWYSRGIDGESATPSVSDAKVSPVETPIGSGTVDYLRRVRNEFRGQGKTKTVDAVGIFGQDIHDKLLIIQALRPAFPDAVFFSSDLDAFYNHPSQIAHTRNMIVASGHGLLPEPDQHHDQDSDVSHIHPEEVVQTPFRDAYQTATFLAIQQAICGLAVEIPPAGLVFEIGNRGPVELPSDGNGCSLATWVCFGFALFGVLLTGAILHWWMTGGRAVSAGAKFLEAHRLWHVVAFLVILLCLTVWVAIGVCHEPASWLDGISVWPTEVIRLLALTLSLVFAYHVTRSLHRATRGVSGATSGRPVALVNAPPLWTSMIASLTAAVASMWRTTAPIWQKLGIAGPVPAQPIDGPASSRPGRREIVRQKCWSALGLAFLLFAAGLAIMAALGMPHIPVRSAVVRTLDKVVVFSSVLAMLWLVFLVIETARQFAALCRTEARKLSRRPEAAPTAIQPATPIATDSPEPAKSASAPDRAEAWHSLRTFLAGLATAGGKGIYGPFIVILFLCLARWRGFDAWTWPIGLQIVLAISGSCVLFAHIYLHKVARGLRDRAIRELSFEIEIDGGSTKRLGLIRDDLSNLSHGIFAGPANHPVMRALIIPFTGIGGLSLLQWVQSM
jgi:hypothetical protein